MRNLYAESCDRRQNARGSVAADTTAAVTAIEPVGTSGTPPPAMDHDWFCAARDVEMEVERFRAKSKGGSQMPLTYALVALQALKPQNAPENSDARRRCRRRWSSSRANSAIFWNRMPVVPSRDSWMTRSRLLSGSQRFAELHLPGHCGTDWRLALERGFAAASRPSSQPFEVELARDAGISLVRPWRASVRRSRASEGRLPRRSN